VLAGVALGLACSLKIWYVAPWAVVIGWLLVTRPPRVAARVAVSGAAALMLVLLPFFILARGRMFDMVVRDQLLRPQAASSRFARLSSILGVQTFVAGHHPEAVLVTVLLLAILATAAAVCWRDRAARIIVVLLAGNLLVLLASPSYFPHYAALTAAPAALVVAIALGKVAATSRWRPVGRVVLLASVAAFLASGIAIASSAQEKSFPRNQFAAAAPPGCVTADDPQALIQMNRLSTDLRSGCRVAIDVTGITYDTLHRVLPHGRQLPRDRNRAFQRFLYDYLVSGSSFVVARRDGDAISVGNARALARSRLLVRIGDLVLRTGNGR
jgi:hypothetical protein